MITDSKSIQFCYGIKATFFYMNPGGVSGVQVGVRDLNPINIFSNVEKGPKGKNGEK